MDKVLNFNVNNTEKHLIYDKFGLTFKQITLFDAKSSIEIYNLLEKYKFKELHKVIELGRGGKSVDFILINDEDIIVTYTYYVDFTPEDKVIGSIGLEEDDDTVYTDSDYSNCGLRLYSNINFDLENHQIIKDYQNLSEYKEKVKNNIFMISLNSGGLCLRKFNLPTKQEINLDTNYNNDFKPIHDVIKDKIMNSSKGVILLHGEPGTGKTYYIRWLIQNIDKPIIFVSPAISTQLAEPSFIDFISSNCSNSLIIIEDAEEVLIERVGGNSAVSNILNIADGLLSDVLNIQILATFNTNFKNIDEALKRKGRIIAEYKFDKLSKDKAQILSDKLGFKTTINEDLNLSEIYNQEDLSFDKKSKKIGFNV